MRKFSGLCLILACLTAADVFAETIEAQLLRDRVGTYEKLSRRLREQGPNASFPEFKPVVDEIIAGLRAPEFTAVIAAHPALQFELNEVETLLFHVNLAFTYEDRARYPYQNPFEGTLPYRPTWDAIEKAAALFDKVDRLAHPEQAGPLYHFDRYAYHRHRMMADPRVVLIPTTLALGFNPLIEVRSVPVGLVGFVFHGSRVDRHYQTPLDFLYHDFNHVRRMVEYLFAELRRRGALTFDDEIAIYRRMDDFIQNTLMPHLQKIPLKDDRERYAKRAMLRVIVFEILHETAAPATREAIIDDLLRRPGITQPFEIMLEEPPGPGFRAENFRTATGNLRSGSTAHRGRAGEVTNIHYIQDRALALLANVNNKLTHGFFDDADDPRSYVVPAEYRTPREILAATKTLFEILEYAPVPDDDTLLGWITATAGGPEKFTYARLRHDADVGANLETGAKPLTVTELLTADRAIELAGEIKGEREIVTFMGNSTREYQDYDVVDDLLIEHLRRLDPARHVINSGATKAGISRVYALAKQMGFVTMGVVSNQALGYAGQFSPFVDHLILIKDDQWGGHTAEGQLTPVTKVFVEASDQMFVVGGGQNTAVTIAAFATTGKPLDYRAAEMNHEASRREALYEKIAPPATFEGAAFAAWRTIARERVARAKAELCAGALGEANPG